ncbi:MAG: DsbE family thiol:disulfide interchange protein [Candidatus Pelagibacter sp.]|jgi:cytochrome c biogenesis protein CcmG/thiol:disulfide interchange protein DsbE|nr:DsbE family thiol:disulfide interchange protein [Candidatus Pelagibacter sp.]
MKKIFLFIPLIIVIMIAVFCLVFLLQGKDPSKPPSALLYKNLPEFNMIGLFDDSDVISNKDLNGNIMLINFFASWCAPCKAEHPLFFEIKKNYPNILLIGINYKDKQEEAINYLNTMGNPYDYVGVDNKGIIGLELGVFGLPETFIVNSKGIIMYKHLGPLTKKIITNEVTPFIQ